MTTPTIRRYLVAGFIVVAVLAVALADIPLISWIAWLAFAGLIGTWLLWLLAKAYQAFLWKVGRRLAFSYFLIGVLPIPMIALLGFGVAYLLGSFFLGHVHRDTTSVFEEKLAAEAELRLEAFSGRNPPEETEAGELTFDYYRDGEWVGGAGVAPPVWPAWMTEIPETGAQPVSSHLARLVRRPDGVDTLAVAVEDGNRGVVAVYQDDLEGALRRATEVWVEVLPMTEGEEAAEADIRIQGQEFRPIGTDNELADRAAERRAFLGQGEGGGWLDRITVLRRQLSGPLVDLASGEIVGRRVRTLLAATPTMVLRRFFAGSSEQESLAWIGLIAGAAGLFTLYLAAVILALALIFGLSRAVNQITRATGAIQQGDFSYRIPVRRRDQLGALQQSVNEMAENLESLVATSAQKEILEKELEIARELQESLLPSDLPQGEAVEFATLFEPSAAIGGDYFDILRLDRDRLAVMIADVSGHGLSSGLRMAMLKAALLILIDEEEDPHRILARLDELVRANAEKRFFVTATLSILDLQTGRLQVTNAGHPPAYRLRDGQIEEIILPGSPLGMLGCHFASRDFKLEPDDMMVWLSDGLIEALDEDGEPFGYERIVAALEGPASSAFELRGRLLAVVDAHAAGRPDDDRTLVVMHYRAAKEGSDSPSVA